MTKVTYRPDEYEMRFEGHAGFSVFGRDIVCAAVSILMWTLTERALENEAYNAAYRVTDADRQDRPTGYAITCDPTPEAAAMCQEMFDTIAVGLTMLAKRYEDYVKFEIINGRNNDD